MNTFVALIRGINIGGKNKIKMADLRQMFEKNGLQSVETYIQSGNVIFNSDENEEVLRKKIEQGMEKGFGISAFVILRKVSELEKLIEKCPFSKKEICTAESLNSEGESLYVSFLTEAPTKDKVEFLDKFRTENEEYRIEERDIYLLLGHSIRNSKLANNLSKLAIPVTTRNWKTINKLYLLAKTRYDK